jgi:DNA-binding MarR family transcriptional regulator
VSPNPSRNPIRPAAPPALPAASLLPLWRRIHGEFVLHSQTWALPTSVSFILVGLHLHPELSEPAVIAKSNYLPRQTTTFILDSLEKDKLAVRKPHPNDRRRKIVQITPKGRAMAAIMVKDMLLFEAKALKTLDTNDFATAKRLLTQYADALALANERKARP